MISFNKQLLSTMTSVLLFFAVSGIGLNAQSLDKKQSLSVELSAGISNIEILSDDNDFILRFRCFDCDIEERMKFGVSKSVQLTINKSFNSKHQLIVGLSLNTWKMEFDIVSGWTGKVLRPGTKTFGFVGATTGYRFVIKEWKRMAVFAQNTVYLEYIDDEIFNKYKLSLAPSLGLSVDFSSDMSLLYSVAYKQSISNLKTKNYIVEKISSIGCKIGLNRRF